MLVTLATAGAIALEDYVEAAAVVVLFAVAEHWERCSTDKARGGGGGTRASCSAAREASRIPQRPVPAAQPCLSPSPLV